MFTSEIANRVFAAAFSVIISAGFMAYAIVPGTAAMA
jgi:hypothetical protein